MPDKKTGSNKAGGFILTLLIAFNLVFQSMALSVHLHSSHEHGGNSISCKAGIPCNDHDHSGDGFSLEKLPPFKTGPHAECRVCKILNNLHNPLAMNHQKSDCFIPFRFEASNHHFDDFICQCKQIYTPRAPPLV